MSTDSTPDPSDNNPAGPEPTGPEAAGPADAGPADAGPARPDVSRPGERDRVSRLFARALEDDPSAGDTPAGVDPTTQDAVNESFRELIDLAYAGDSRAELAMRALLDVEVARADTDGVMPTPARFEQTIDRAWTAHLTRRADGRSGDMVIRPDGTLGCDDDTDDAGPWSGLG